MQFNLEKILAREELTADGKPFGTLDVLAGKVRQVTLPDGTTEWRRWKKSKPKRKNRMICGAKCRDGHECRARGARYEPMPESWRALCRPENRSRPSSHS